MLPPTGQPASAAQPSGTHVLVPVRVLVIEDSPLDTRLIGEWLREAGAEHFAVRAVDRLSTGVAAVEAMPPDVVLLDLGLPDSQGLDTFRRLHAAAPQVPVVVLSGLDDQELALHAVQAGAQDFLAKQHASGEVLDRILRYAVERGHLLAQATTARAEAEAARAEAEAAHADAETARRRAELLAQASDVFAQSLDLPTTLREVADLVVGTLASYCTIDLLTADGTLQRLVARSADPQMGAATEQLARYAPQPQRPHPAWEALQTGQPVLSLDVPDAWLAAIAWDAEHLAVLHHLQVRAWLAVPLQARGRMLGTLQLLWTAAEARPLAPAAQADLLAATRALAGRAAVALDNARLHSEVQTALVERETALAARDALLASVAHDLRNPLGAIKLHAQLAQRALSRGRLAPKLAHSLARIDKLTLRMDSFIQELVDAARLQAGEQITLSRAPTDLVALVRTTLDLHSEHPVRFEAAEAALPATVDTTRMLRVLGNLLSNAAKYSPPDREVLVTLTQEDAAEGAWAVLQVQDQGLGIPAAEVPHIFEPYHRASNVQGRVQGTGLGLWGSQRIVEQHGGTLTLQSKEGVGTTVSVRLPLMDAAPDGADVALA